MRLALPIKAHLSALGDHPRAVGVARPVRPAGVNHQSRSAPPPEPGNHQQGARAYTSMAVRYQIPETYSRTPTVRESSVTGHWSLVTGHTQNKDWQGGDLQANNVRPRFDQGPVRCKTSRRQQAMPDRFEGFTSTKCRPQIGAAQVASGMKSTKPVLNRRQLRGIMMQYSTVQCQKAAPRITG